MGFDFSFLTVVLYTAYAAVIGLMLSAILLVISIGINIPAWALWLSFAIPTIVGFLIGVYDYRRDKA